MSHPLSDASAIGESPTFQLPLLRFRHRLRRPHLIALYDTHVLKGTCRRGCSITESMCTAEGESELVSQMRGVRRMDFADVSSVSVVVMPGAAPEGPARRFTLRGRQRTLRFKLPVGQTSHVDRFLQTRFSDHYRSRKQWVSASVGVVLLVLGSLLTVLSELRFPGAGVGLAVIGAGVWVLRFAGSKWQAAGKDISQPPAPHPPAHRDVKHARKPLRSRPLGWFLKACGLAWFVIIFSPLSYGVQAWLLSIVGNSSSVRYLWVVILAPAPLLVFMGYQLSQRAHEPKGTGDKRRPILYLRPFGDDRSTSLQPGGVFSDFCGIRSMPGNPLGATSSGRMNPAELLGAAHPIRLLRMFFNYDTGTSEESITRFFESYGPLIAIGRPGERLATPGAARTYVDDTSWQETVSQEMLRAQAVVVQPAPTAGVLWELSQIRQDVEPFRVLICLVSYWRNPEAYQALLEVAARAGIELPRVVPHLRRPAFVYFDSRWKPQLQELSYKSPALWPLTADGTDLKYTLLPFVQGMHGGEREPPRAARWTEGASTSIVRMAGAAIAAVVWIAVPVSLAAVWPSSAGTPVLQAMCPAEELRPAAAPSAVGESPSGTPDVPSYSSSLVNALAERRLSLSGGWVQMTAEGQADSTLFDMNGQVARYRDSRLELESGGNWGWSNTSKNLAMRASMQMVEGGPQSLAGFFFRNRENFGHAVWASCTGQVVATVVEDQVSKRLVAVTRPVTVAHEFILEALAFDDSLFVWVDGNEALTATGLQGREVPTGVAGVIAAASSPTWAFDDVRIEGVEEQPRP